MPNLDAQIAALGIAFIELAKMMGREQIIMVTQLASAIETAAKDAKSNTETQAAAEELSRRLR